MNFWLNCIMRNRTLIADDNLLILWTMHFGIEDHSSFCEMFVIERDRLPDWMEEHKNMLIEG